MTLGSLILRIRLRYRHGLRVAYWRDTARRRILDTPPVTDTCDRRCEIHALTSATDWLNLIWALKSFYHSADRRYALCIHDDGTLTDEELALLQRHFPQGRLVRRDCSDKEVSEWLAAYPRCREFRRSNHLAPKVLDFARYLESDRLLLLDSDVLFFGPPTELLRRIDAPDYRLNCVNRDVNSAYTVDAELVRERLGLELLPRFNSGLGLIHRDSLRREWIEEFLALPGILSHSWRIEQTLFALCSSRFGVELLPSEYDVHLDGGPASAPCRHYVGEIRHLLYREGIRRLVQSGFLDHTRRDGPPRTMAAASPA